MIEATLADILYVCRNMREVDSLEIFGGRDIESPDHLAAELWLRPGVKMTWHKNGIPVAVGGLVPMNSVACDAWLFGTDEWRERIITITRDCKTVMQAHHDNGYKRIQAISWKGHTEAHGWLKKLGYKQGEEMKCYGNNGDSYIMFERIQ